MSTPLRHIIAQGESETLELKTPSMIIADKMINGNLFDVVEESMQTIIGHLKFAFEITGKTTQRTEIPEYPLDAIREALLNSLIHRDYQSPTDVQIKIFDKKITFFNPGGLFGKITEEELKTDVYQASTRNKQIAEAFYLTGDIEKYGSGFMRIRKAISLYPTMKMDYTEKAGGFMVTLSYTQQKMSTEQAGVNEGVNKLLEIIGKSPGKRMPHYASVMQIPEKTMERWIKQLREGNKVEFRGAAKTGGYFTVNHKK